MADAILKPLGPPVLWEEGKSQEAPQQANADVLKPVKSGWDEDSLVRRAAHHARQVGIPEDLFVALVKQESDFNPDAKSPTGVKGLAQVTKATGKPYGQGDRSDPDESLRVGAAHYRDLLNRHGSHRKALMAYNGGSDPKYDLNVGRRLGWARQKLQSLGPEPEEYLKPIGEPTEWKEPAGGPTVQPESFLSSLSKVPDMLGEVMPEVAGLTPRAPAPTAQTMPYCKPGDDCGTFVTKHMNTKLQGAGVTDKQALLPESNLGVGIPDHLSSKFKTPLLGKQDITVENLMAMGPGTVIAFNRKPGDVNYRPEWDTHAEVTEINPATGQLMVASKTSGKDVRWKPIDEKYIASLGYNAKATNPFNSKALMGAPGGGLIPGQDQTVEMTRRMQGIKDKRVLVLGDNYSMMADLDESRANLVNLESELKKNEPLVIKIHGSINKDEVKTLTEKAKTLETWLGEKKAQYDKEQPKTQEEVNAFNQKVNAYNDTIARLNAITAPLRTPEYSNYFDLSNRYKEALSAYNKKVNDFNAYIKQYGGEIPWETHEEINRAVDLGATPAQVEAMRNMTPEQIREYRRAVLPAVMPSKYEGMKTPESLPPGRSAILKPIDALTRAAGELMAEPGGSAEWPEIPAGDPKQLTRALQMLTSGISGTLYQPPPAQPTSGYMTDPRGLTIPPKFDPAQQALDTSMFLLGISYPIGVAMRTATGMVTIGTAALRSRLGLPALPAAVRAVAQNPWMRPMGIGGRTAQTMLGGAIFGAGTQAAGGIGAKLAGTKEQPYEGAFVASGTAYLLNNLGYPGAAAKVESISRSMGQVAGTAVDFALFHLLAEGLIGGGTAVGRSIRDDFRAAQAKKWEARYADAKAEYDRARKAGEAPGTKPAYKINRNPKNLEEAIQTVEELRENHHYKELSRLYKRNKHIREAGTYLDYEAGGNDIPPEFLRETTVRQYNSATGEIEEVTQLGIDPAKRPELINHWQNIKAQVRQTARTAPETPQETELVSPATEAMPTEAPASPLSPGVPPEVSGTLQAPPRSPVVEPLTAPVFGGVKPADDFQVFLQEAGPVENPAALAPEFLIAKGPTWMVSPEGTKAIARDDRQAKEFDSDFAKLFFRLHPEQIGKVRPEDVWRHVTPEDLVKFEALPLGKSLSERIELATGDRLAEAQRGLAEQQAVAEEKAAIEAQKQAEKEAERLEKEARKDAEARVKAVAKEIERRSKEAEKAKAEAQKEAERVAKEKKKAELKLRVAPPPEPPKKKPVLPDVVEGTLPPQPKEFPHGLKPGDRISFQQYGKEHFGTIVSVFEEDGPGWKKGDLEVHPDGTDAHYTTAMKLKAVKRTTVPTPEGEEKKIVGGPQTELPKGVRLAPTPAPKAAKEPWEMTREEYRNFRMKDIPLIQKKIDELLEDREYIYYAIRVLPNDMPEPKIGDVLEPSYQWIDGERTEEGLGGTSGIGLLGARETKPISLEKVDQLMQYAGDKIAIIAGDNGYAGEDPGEIVIEDAEVLAIFNNPWEISSFHRKSDYDWNHEYLVKDAIRQGKTVPPEVLAEYPDLAKPKPAEPAGGGAKPAPVPAKGKGVAVKEALSGELKGEDEGKKVKGKTFKAGTDAGTKIEGHYALVELNDLIASHDTGMNRNPAYPQELQPRERDRSTYMMQVGDIATKLDPFRLGSNPMVTDGAPVVGPDMVVESGNGRTIALKMAAEGNLHSSGVYDLWLKESAGEYGFTDEDLEKFSKPLLVRIRETEVDRQQFVRDANAPTVAAMSTSEQAKADVRNLTEGGLLDNFRPDESGNLLTVSTRATIRAFLNRVASKSEMGRYVTRDGEVSQEGINRFRNALFAAAYGESMALEKLAESTNDAARTITQAMTVVAGRMAKLNRAIEKKDLPDISIAPNLADAADILQGLRESGAKPITMPSGKTVSVIENYFKNGLFDQDPLTIDILSVFDRFGRSRKKLVEMFSNYLDLAENIGSPKQGNIFGSQATYPTKAELFRAAQERMEADYGVDKQDQAAYGEKTEAAPGQVEKEREAVKPKAEVEGGKKPVKKPKPTQEPEEEIAMKFGEHIGGSRFDKAHGILTVDDLAGMTDREAQEIVNKHNVWRKPDYTAMVEEGTPPHIAYLIKKMRDALPLTPSKAENRELFIKEVGRVRDIISDAKDESDVSGFFAQVFPAELYDHAKRQWTPEGRKVGLVLGNKFVKEIQVTRWGFEQAKRWVVGHEWPFAKGTPTGERRKLPERPMMEHIARTGKDYRQGRNISPTEFQETFGFRGGEFGKWLNQADRQDSLNFAYDAFMDLAAILDIPPKAIGLNGELGFAFGARGEGKHGAHYEPGKIAINLTKTRGAGATAHEWAHALDDYFVRLAGVKQIGEYASTLAARGFRRVDRTGKQVDIQLRPEIQKAWKAVSDAITHRYETYEEAVESARKEVENSKRYTESWLGGIRRTLDDKAHANFDALSKKVLSGDQEALGKIISTYNPKADIRKGLRTNFDYLKIRLRRSEDLGQGKAAYNRKKTDFLKEAERLDAKKSKKYWSTHHELFARAFETYIESKVEGLGNKSQYLVHSTFTYNKGYEDATGYRPYPVGAEMEAINKAFDDLFAVMESAESTTKKGAVALYQPKWKGNQLTWASVPPGKIPKTAAARLNRFVVKKGDIKTGEIGDDIPLTENAYNHWKQNKSELGYASIPTRFSQDDVVSILSAVRRGEASVGVNRMGVLAFYKIKLGVKYRPKTTKLLAPVLEKYPDIDQDRARQVLMALPKASPQDVALMVDDPQYPKLFNAVAKGELSIKEIEKVAKGTVGDTAKQENLFGNVAMPGRLFRPKEAISEKAEVDKTQTPARAGREAPLRVTYNPEDDLGTGRELRNLKSLIAETADEDEWPIWKDLTDADRRPPDARRIERRAKNAGFAKVYWVKGSGFGGAVTDDAGGKALLIDQGAEAPASQVADHETLHLLAEQGNYEAHQLIARVNKNSETFKAYREYYHAELGMPEGYFPDHIIAENIAADYYAGVDLSDYDIRLRDAFRQKALASALRYKVRRGAMKGPGGVKYRPQQAGGGGPPLDTKFKNNLRIVASLPNSIHPWKNPIFVYENPTTADLNAIKREQGNGVRFIGFRKDMYVFSNNLIHSEVLAVLNNLGIVKPGDPITYGTGYLGELPGKILRISQTNEGVVGRGTFSGKYLSIVPKALFNKYRPKAGGGGPPASVTEAQERVRGRISRNEYDKRPSRWSFSRLYTDWVDRFNPMMKMLKAYSPGEVPTNQDPYKQARLFVGWHGKADAFLQYHPFDRKTMKFLTNINSLRDILKPLKENGHLEDFDDYLVARRALERNAKGLETGVDVDAAQMLVDHYEPYFEAYAAEYDAFNDSVLRYYRDSGLISQERYQKIKEGSQDYAPLMRLIEPEKGQSGGKGFEARQVLKRFKGSERKVISPLESTIKMTYLMINAAERNYVGRAFVNWAKDTEAFGEEVKKVAPKVRPIKTSLREVLGSDWSEEIEAKLSDEGIEADEAIIFRPSGFRPGKNAIAVYEDGKRNYYQVPEDIAEIIGGLDEQTADLYLRLLAAPARALRLGATVLTPEFGPYNIVKDQIAAFIHSDVRYLPFFDAFRGIAEIAKGGKKYWEYLISGAGHSELVAMDRKMLQKKMDDLIAGRVSAPGFFLRHPIEAMKILSQYSEQGTRLGYFMKKTKGEDVSPEEMMEGGFGARELTTDFSRRGARGKALNMLTAFWNAGIQGFNRFTRAHRQQPRRTMMRAILAITIPAILLELAFKDDERYQNLPWWRRDLFFNIPTSIGVISIPKTWNYGLVYGSIPQRIVNYILKQDIHAFDGLLQSIGRETPDIPIPTVAKPLLETWGNRSFFFDRPIVPSWKEDFPPQYQFGPWTSETAKAMGNLISKLPMIGDSKAASPAILEHFVYSWTGGFGRLALNSVDWTGKQVGLFNAAPSPTRSLADYPIVRRFVARYPASNAEPIKRFYDNVKWIDNHKMAATLEAKRLEQMGRKDEGTKLLEGLTAEKCKNTHDSKKAMSNAWKYIEMVQNHPDMSPDLKRQAIEKTYITMINAAKEFNKAFDLARGKPQEKPQTLKPLTPGSKGPVTLRYLD